MPFDPARPLNGGPVAVGEYDKPDPGFLDTLGAALRQENIVGSSAAYLVSARAGVSDFNRVDPEYNVFDDVKRDQMDRYRERFETIYNREAYDATVADIRKEEKDRQILDASGWTGTTLSAGASILDPTMLLPAGQIRQGAGVLEAAARVGVAAGAATAVQEAGLHATQELRTPAESFASIGGSVLLGGLLGGAAGKFFTNAQWDAAAAGLKADLSRPPVDMDAVADAMAARQSAGAAAVPDAATLEDLGMGELAGGRFAKVGLELLSGISPNLRLKHSASRAAREIGARLIDDPTFSAMHADGRTLGADAENLAKVMERGAVARAMPQLQAGWREAKGEGFAGTKADFNERVAFAMRRGDVDPESRAVTRIAQTLRKEFDAFLKRAQQAGLLPDDAKVATALSYVSRVWSPEKLIAQETVAKERFASWFRQQMHGISDETLGVVSKADREALIQENAAAVFRKLTGRDDDSLPDFTVAVVGRRGPLAERTFGIPDASVEDFLENDIEYIFRRHARVMAADISLKEKFGHVTMRDQIADVRREYEALRADTPRDDAAARLKLKKAEDADIEALQAVRDRLRGTYKRAENNGNWGRIARQAKNFNYVTKMGGVVLSSLTDVVRPIAVHGLRAYLTEGLPALVHGLRRANAAEAISREDARLAGVVAERVMQSRLATLAELNDPMAKGSRLERTMANATTVFSRMTGMGWWNDTMKTMSSVMTANRILGNAERGFAGISAAERKYMAFLGVDDDMASRIGRQFAAHGATEDGVRGANLDDWTDEGARRAYGAALAKDVDRIIVTKGAGDTPLFMDTPTGSVITQFKSFGIASIQRVLIAGLQEDAQRFGTYVVAATVIGMMVDYLKLLERLEHEEANALLDNPGKWIASGFDRTGVPFLFMEPLNMADKGLGLGVLDAGRFRSRNQIGAILGPSVGTYEDIARLVKMLQRMDPNGGDIGAVTRMTPGATLPGLRTAIQGVLKPMAVEAVE